MSPDGFRKVSSPPHNWNLIETGQGPKVLMLHGAGGSAESFAGIISLLKDRFHVVAPDLPGHHETRLGSRARSGLRPMAVDLATLMQTLNFAPDFIIGHSAGGALSLALDAPLSPQGHFLINPALGSFEGAAAWVFPAMAKLLSVTPGAARMISTTLGRPEKIKGLLRATGSPFSQEMEDRYLALSRRTDHVQGTLMMMASWDLRDLFDSLETVSGRVSVIVGDEDGTVPIAQTQRVLARLGMDAPTEFSGGHLLHEERAELVSNAFVAFTDSVYSSEKPSMALKNASKPASI